MSIHKKLQHLWTSQNIVLMVASVISLAWAWGSINTLQRNYDLQQQVNQLDIDTRLLQLEADNLQLEQAYYNTDEYIELRVRDDLGLAAPGEKMIILPRYQPPADQPARAATSSEPETQRSNLEQWIEFFFRGQ